MPEEITSGAQPVESASPVESPAVETPSEETSHAETQTEPVEVGTQSSTVANGNAGRNDKSQFTDLEKAQYSFRKQFARQKAKHDEEIANLRKEFQERLNTELDKVAHPEKYRPKTRADFPIDEGGDDAYIKHIVGQIFEEKVKSWTENAQKEEEEKTRADAELQDCRALVNANAEKIYTTPEALEDWKEKIRLANELGIPKMLEKFPAIANYIMYEPLGPKVMYDLANDPDLLDTLLVRCTLPSGKKVYNDPITLNRKFWSYVEKMSSAQPTVVQPQETTQPVNPVQPTKEVKHAVGKPGKTNEAKKSLFDDSKALLEFMYK